MIHSPCKSNARQEGRKQGGRASQIHRLNTRDMTR
nr:MAG TPA: hypothetical protein [Caudoviricetes sp.]